jgi:hypothetical protein
MRALAIATVALSLTNVAHAELEKTQIRKVIKAHIHEVVACFDREPPPPDQIAYVDFTIARDGTVTKAVGSGNPAVHDCLADVIRKLRFPTSNTSTGVRYPFNIDYVHN